jgi:hypothetical protein
MRVEWWGGTIEADRVLATASDLQEALGGQILRLLGRPDRLIVAHAKLSYP